MTPRNRPSGRSASRIWTRAPGRSLTQCSPMQERMRSRLPARNGRASSDASTRAPPAAGILHAFDQRLDAAKTTAHLAPQGRQATRLGRDISCQRKHLADIGQPVQQPFRQFAEQEIVAGKVALRPAPLSRAPASGRRHDAGSFMAAEYADGPCQRNAIPREHGLTGPGDFREMAAWPAISVPLPTPAPARCRIDRPRPRFRAAAALPEMW